jgi:hypothetical protein
MLAEPSKFAIPFVSGAGSREARNPFNILLPETDDTVVSFGRMPNSFNLRSAPR